MTPEGKIKAKIKLLLKSYGRKVMYDMPVPVGFGRSGLDFTCCVNGWFLVIEAKQPGKHMTPAQLRYAARIREAGGAVIEVSNPEDLVTLDNLIKGMLTHARSTLAL